MDQIYAQPTFTRHTHGIWSWVTAQWEGESKFTLVSVELAREHGWLFKDTFLMGPYRLKFVRYSDIYAALACYRLSRPPEEKFRARLWIASQLARSLWRHLMKIIANA